MMRHFLLLCCLAFCLTTNAQNRHKPTEVMLETTAGNIRIKLFDETPLHRDNFVRLVNLHVYDSLLFHRVIKDFMIQAGDPKSKDAKPGDFLGEGDLDWTVEQELRLPQIFHKRGTLAAAREPDEVNPYRTSSACQFYLVWGKKFNDEELDKLQARLDTLHGYPVKLTPEMRETYKNIGGTPHLDGGYTVFGEIVEGLDVVDKIQQAATDKNDRPVEDQRIIKAYILEEPKPKAQKAQPNSSNRQTRRR